MLTGDRCLRPLHLTREDLLSEVLKASLQPGELGDRTAPAPTLAAPRGSALPRLLIVRVMAKAVVTTRNSLCLAPAAIGSNTTTERHSLPLPPYKERGGSGAAMAIAREHSPATPAACRHSLSSVLIGSGLYQGFKHELSGALMLLGLQGRIRWVRSGDVAISLSCEVRGSLGIPRQRAHAAPPFWPLLLRSTWSRA